MTNIALVGVGYWGKNLARVFNEIGVLKSVCDLNEKNLNEIKKSYPKLKLTKNFQEILKEKDIKDSHNKESSSKNIKDNKEKEIKTFRKESNNLLVSDNKVQVETISSKNKKSNTPAKKINIDLKSK